MINKLHKCYHYRKKKEKTCTTFEKHKGVKIILQISYFIAKGGTKPEYLKISQFYLVTHPVLRTCKAAFLSSYILLMFLAFNWFIFSFRSV